MTPSFVREWIELLKRPVPEIRHRLTSRDKDMTRLRLSSPFVLAEGLDFEEEALRRRIWRPRNELPTGPWPAIKADHPRVMR